jgi:hypothetical protein
MFGVIVLGGISLTAASPEAIGCGGAVATPADGGGSQDSFPDEGIDSSNPPVDSGTRIDP